MSLLKKMFGKKDEPLNTPAAFWAWFQQHEKKFHRIISTNNNVEEDLLNKIIPQLHQLNEKFYCLAGMDSDTVAELVITADGDIKSFVFVEDLVNAAPAIPGWKFTAHKPAVGTDEISIEMDSYTFNADTIRFVAVEEPTYPDEIQITLLHNDLTPENEPIISNGCLLFIDNALGEISAATLIDNLTIGSKDDVEGDPIPISKLHDYLTWREKEFTERYKGSRHHTEDDQYATLEASDKAGLPLMAVINTDLLNWDAKPSHPWMLLIEINYEDHGNGMPDNSTYELMNEFEDKLTAQLVDKNGYLNLGRQTYNSTRTIYIACKEFRESSRITAETISRFDGQLDITYSIYRDKYWMTMDRFK